MPTGVINQTLDERLDKLEVALNQTQRTLARVVALMDGDPGYRIVGMPDQLAAYIKANEDWKTATENRIVNSEKQLSNLLAHNSTIVISRAAAIALTLIGSLCLIVAFLVLTWLQRAG